jgi:hypothetical protein
MTLASIAEKLQSDAERLLMARREETHREQWLARTRTLDQVAADLRGPAASLIWLESRLGRRASLSRVKQALEKVEWLHGLLEGSAEGLAAGGEIGEVADSARRAIQEVERVAEESWGAYRSEKVPVWDPAILAPLARHPDSDVRRRVREAFDAHERLERLLQVRLPSVADLEATEAAVTEREELRESLPVDLPADVAEFLIAASGAGAALSTLSPSVRAWLEEHGQLDAYVVRPRSAQDAGSVWLQR